MKVLVDKMPKSGSECLFKKYYNEQLNTWNCGFWDTRICSLDCGEGCLYLAELKENTMNDNSKMK